MENYAGLMQAKKGIDAIWFAFDTANLPSDLRMVLAEALIDAIGKWEDLNEEERAAK